MKVNYSIENNGLKYLSCILFSAMKRSLRAYKPVLSEPVQLNDFLKKDVSGTRGIAHCHPTERFPITGMERSGHYTLLVGPEGDFTDEEVSRALDAGYTQFHLGDTRMRTETAGVHLCSAIKILESTKQ